jgi:hypothetical protein
MSDSRNLTRRPSRNAGRRPSLAYRYMLLGETFINAATSSAVTRGDLSRSVLASMRGPQ